ncbi:TetR/AcrR family transcriptional regulator [Rhizobium halophytocola]|uniref:AcrR family transcriptional regulator n=1 Tax=Rhizobium halophytocola TaxID=735519 RepID=A0ABS4E5I7_9HYPH|nr:TetR/AcrR family transcriptional regulator [Rhizobium halophytocola]MBP1853216.1 AcrR family transcriptional regulator [Rhizobium halophytocola]
MAKMSREESRGRTREKLIDAARQAVAENGYDGTSIADIAARAGFTKGALFSNFASKEEIFLEVLRRHKAEEFAAFRAVVDAVKAGRADAGAIDAYLAGLDGTADLARLDIELRLHAGRSETFAAAFAAFDGETRQTLAGIIADIHLLGGKPVPADTEDLALLFLGLIHGLALHGDANPSGKLKRVMDAILKTA